MRFEDKATINILARTSSSVFLLVSSVIMVRYLSKEDYGTFLQVMLVLNTVLMLAFVGLPHSVFYYYPQTLDKRHLVMQTLRAAFAISGIAACIVFVLRNPLAQWFNNPDLTYFGVVAALLILCQGPVGFRDPILLSQNALILSSVLTILTCLLNYIPLFVGLFLGIGLKGIMLVFLGSNITNLLIFLIMIGYLFKDAKLAGRPSEGAEQQYFRITLREQFRYSFPIGLASCVGILSKQIDKYIISSLFMPAQFAIYSRGAMEVPLVGNVTYTLNDMSMPRYVAAYRRNDVHGFLELMHLNLDKVAKVNFGVFVFLFFEAKLLIEVLYTREYIGAAPIFQAYLFLLFLGITVYGMIPRVTGHTRQLTTATVLSLVLNVALSLQLISIWGPIGVAIGAVCGSLGYMVYLLFCAVRDLKVGWREIMPWADLIKNFACAAFSSLLLWGYHSLLKFAGVDGNVWVLCGAFPIYAYGYLVFLIAMGLMTKEDLNYLERWLRFNPLAIAPLGRTSFERGGPSMKPAGSEKNAET